MGGGDGGVGQNLHVHVPETAVLQMILRVRFEKHWSVGEQGGAYKHLIPGYNLRAWETQIIASIFGKMAAPTATVTNRWTFSSVVPGWSTFWFR